MNWPDLKINLQHFGHNIRLNHELVRKSYTCPSNFWRNENNIYVFLKTNWAIVENNKGKKEQ